MKTFVLTLVACFIVTLTLNSLFQRASWHRIKACEVAHFGTDAEHIQSQMDALVDDQDTDDLCIEQLNAWVQLLQGRVNDLQRQLDAANRDADAGSIEKTAQIQQLENIVIDHESRLEK